MGFVLWGDFHLTSKRLDQNKMTGGGCRLLPHCGVAYQLVEYHVSSGLQSCRVKVQTGVKLSGEITQNYYLLPQTTHHCFSMLPSLLPVSTYFTQASTDVDRNEKLCAEV